MTVYRLKAETDPELAPYDCVDGKMCPRCGECDWETAVSPGCPRNGLAQTMYCHIQSVHRHVLCWRCGYEVITESRKAYIERQRAEREHERARRRALVRRLIPRPDASLIALEWALFIVIALGALAATLLWGWP